VILTQEEQEYIKNNPIIILGGAKSFVPYLIQEYNGEIQILFKPVRDIYDKFQAVLNYNYIPLDDVKLHKPLLRIINRS